MTKKKAFCLKQIGTVIVLGQRKVIEFPGKTVPWMTSEIVLRLLASCHGAVSLAQVVLTVQGKRTPALR
jgi:hypothetical protein